MPLFEDDYFRYLWDGFQFAQTGTPYGAAPAAFFADAQIPQVFQRILDHINYPDVPTIYGPVTELLFLLAYLLEPGSLIPLQALLIGVDILLIRLLLTVAQPTHVLLYAWCPLVIKEIAFTAHPDGLGVSLAIAAVVLSSRRHTVGAAICIALAVGAKVFALLLVPFVLARAGPRAWLAFVGACAVRCRVGVQLRTLWPRDPVAVADADEMVARGSPDRPRWELLAGLPARRAGADPAGGLDLRRLSRRRTGDQPLVRPVAAAVRRNSSEPLGMDRIAAP